MSGTDMRKLMESFGAIEEAPIMEKSGIHGMDLEAVLKSIFDYAVKYGQRQGEGYADKAWNLIDDLIEIYGPSVPRNPKYAHMDESAPLVEASGRFLCSEATADGDQFFVVDSKKTFNAIVQAEAYAFDEAESWGGFQIGLKAATLFDEYDLEGDDLKLAKKNLKSLATITWQDAQAMIAQVEEAAEYDEDASGIYQDFMHEYVLYDLLEGKATGSSTAAPKEPGDEQLKAFADSDEVNSLVSSIARSATSHFDQLVAARNFKQIGPDMAKLYTKIIGVINQKYGSQLLDLNMVKNESYPEELYRLKFTLRNVTQWALNRPQDSEGLQAVAASLKSAGL